MKKKIWEKENGDEKEGEQKEERKTKEKNEKGKAKGKDEKKRTIGKIFLFSLPISLKWGKKSEGKTKFFPHLKFFLLNFGDGVQ